MHRRVFLAGAMAAPALAAAWKSRPPQEFLSDLSRWMEVAPVPGVWVTFLERGKVAWEQGFGVRSAATRQPVGPDTIFEAASLTKQVTACVAHGLHAEGTLDWDKPLNDYVPGLSDEKAKRVTARHVLSHSSGFPNWRNDRGEILKPAFEPGSSFQYSGEGYVYLSRVLEQVSGKPFAELAQARVFNPLRMNDSSLIRLPERSDRMAMGHGRHGALLDSNGNTARRFTDLARTSAKPITQWRYGDLEAALEKAGSPALPNWMQPNAAASFCTTGPDYAKFVLAAMRNPDLRQQQSRIGAGRDWSLGWGLGWGIEHSGARGFLFQWGDNSGYKNIVMIDPVAESGIFVFTNGDGGARIYERVVAQATGIDHPAFLWI